MACGLRERGVAARSDESCPLQVVTEQGVQELVLGQRWYDVVALMAQLADHARNVQILCRRNDATIIIRSDYCELNVRT